MGETAQRNVVGYECAPGKRQSKKRTSFVLWHREMCPRRASDLHEYPQMDFGVLVENR